MEQIKLFEFSENGADCIGLTFNFSEKIKSIIKSSEAFKWHQTKRFYYMDRENFKLHKIYRQFQKDNIFVDYSAIKKKEIHTKSISPKIYNRTKDGRTLSEIQKQLIREFVAYLRGLRFSDSTVRTYFTFVADFISFCHDTPTALLSNAHVRLFVETQVKRRNYSVSTHRQLISAIKHLGTFLSNSMIINDELPRPHKSSYLPTVLSKEEIIDLLRFTKNQKHRTILALIYSCGLRIGEVINLKLYDVDIDRRQLVVRQAKGRKDRLVVLAQSFIPLFQSYFMTYQPKEFFIENPKGGLYNAGSIRSFLKVSCKAAKIRKPVTPHTLRHSYATHLIENGVGLRYVQELLGHAKPETTMIYTHVAKKDILNIESPLDTALKSFYNTDKPHTNINLSQNISG